MKENKETDTQDFFTNIGVFLVNFASKLVSFHEWVEKNKTNIADFLLRFSNFSAWYVAIQKLSQNQILFIEDIDIEFATKIKNSNDIKTMIERYYFDNSDERINTLILDCKNAVLLSKYKELYIQTITAYKNGSYQLACIGLFCIIDGLLSDVSGMIKETSFKKRIENIENKIQQKIEIDNIDKKILSIYMTRESFDETIFGHSDFSKPEKDVLNRHWLLHGRTQKKYTKYDFLKILLWLNAIIFLADIESKINYTSNEQEG